MLKAAFWLLAIVVLTELMLTVAFGAGCFWMIVVSAQIPIGGCANVGQQIREVWAEVLAAILALLLASRGNGSPPSPPTKPD
jgi:hypothetical protein